MMYERRYGRERCVVYIEAKVAYCKAPLAAASTAVLVARHSHRTIYMGCAIYTVHIAMFSGQGQAVHRYSLPTHARNAAARSYIFIIHDR